MPGSSRRVRAMSDESPPAGALRLARVAGVPVYLDRTWLFLGAFVAWTGWQRRQRPGHRHGAGVRGAGWSSASWSPCSATRSPTPSPPGCSGSGCTASSRPSGAGTPPTTRTGSTPGSRRRHRRRRTRWPTSRSRRSGGRDGRRPAVARIASSRWLVHVPQPAARRCSTCCPGCRSTVASSCSRWSGGSAVAATSGWSSPAGAAGCSPWGSSSGTSSGPWPRARPTCSASASGLVMAWILWSGATAALKRAPLERLLLRVRPEDVMDPVAVVPALTPVGELVGIGRRVVALDERGMPDPAAARAVGDLARHRDPAAHHAAGVARRQGARRLRRRARAGRRRRAGAAGDGDDRVGRRRRDLGRHGARPGRPRSGSTPWPRPCSAATRLPAHDTPHGRRAAARPLLRGRAHPAHRPEGPDAHHRAEPREAVPHPPRAPRPRRPDRDAGRLDGHEHRGRRVPRAAPAAVRLRDVDAARCRRGLPQGRRPDRDDGRHVPRRGRRRGRGGLRCPVDVAAAGRGGVGARALLRAPRGLRRHRHGQRARLLRHRPPGVDRHRGRPRRGAAAHRRERHRRPGRARHARARGSASRSSPTPSRPVGC